MVDSKFRELPLDFHVYSLRGEVRAHVYRYDQLDAAVEELKGRFGDWGELPGHNVFTGMSKEGGHYDEESALAVRRYFHRELLEWRWMRAFDPLM